MTIEEYDKKAGVRKVIRQIDCCLQIIRAERNGLCMDVGLGIKFEPVIAATGVYDEETTAFIDDPALVKKIEHLLKERKQELIDEFSK